MSKKFKILLAFVSKYRRLLFFIASIIYFELVYILWSFKSISIDFAFPLLFSISAGTVLFLISGIFSVTVNRLLTILLTFLLIIGYNVQLIYYCIFHTPLSLFSLTGAGEAMQFGDIILSSILKNIIAVILLFIPLIYLLATGRRFLYTRIKILPFGFVLLFCIISYVLSLICVNLTGNGALSQYALYYKVASPELSVYKLGLLTTMRLDLKRLVFGFEQKDEGVSTAVISDLSDDIKDDIKTEDNLPKPDTTNTESIPIVTYNMMSIDFDSLVENETDQTLIDMHKYFSSVNPTKQNDYTGIFKGNNLILMTAEGFSPYAVNAELTPTLYKMSTEGFSFKNFYTPIWGVSTSDGEYVACTGLIPKSGIWSFAASGENWLPFVMGNQFKKLGYTTKAYHNHSYTYYKRDISHPNMGYDYKGIGNGLSIKKTWPESDLEMVDATVPEYIYRQPFHTYYMTVSGHLRYSFTGNYIAKKNQSLVADLPYSDESKAYLACNLELEFALKSLIEKLEDEGIADKTVIAISPDHYPYGLSKEGIDELAGHKVENNFELYKSIFILWKKGMKPVVINKPCSSLDIIPTLSNLFGLEYDSRLLMGTDILSDAQPLVIFSNQSWITDKAMHNSMTNTTTYTDDADKDVKYVHAINNAVADKFKFSAKILEKDYYSKLGIKP